MKAKQKYPAAEDALAAAILAARQAPGRLYDASFGRYVAEGEGWHWSLHFLQEFDGSVSGPLAGDTFDERLPKIIAKWSEDVAKYGEYDKERAASAG